MPITVAWFEADHKSIGAFLRSNQLRDAVRQGAEDVRAIAASESSTIGASFRVERGPDVIVTKRPNPRLSEHVRNDHRAAAAIEFGSGIGRPGSSGHRPQGGSSDPKRILGRAGARIGDRLGTSDD